LGVGGGHTQLPAPADLRSAAAGPYPPLQRLFSWVAHPTVVMIVHSATVHRPQVAKWAGIDSPAVVLRTPQLLQAACAALTDVYVYLLALQRFGPAVAGRACLRC
jgi:hypothetical protein